MAQELVLFGQLPANNHQPLRQHLAGLARMQPQAVLERHLIFRPLPPTGTNNIPSGSGQTGLHQQDLQKTRQMLNAPLSYIQLVGLIKGRGLASQVAKYGTASVELVDEDVAMTDFTAESNHIPTDFQWTLEFKDIPDPGKVPTTSRAVSKTLILGGDPIQFLRDLGYEFLSQYVVTGDRFYDQDTMLFLHRVLQASDAATQDAGIAFSAVNVVPDVTKLVPLDPSGGYILQASIEITDRNSPDLKDKAMQQLLALKEILRSSVDLEPGDRLALDTRVPMRKVR